MFIAVRTGLEPATSGVTGRHSNQAELPHRFSLCPLHFRKGLQRYSVFTYLQIFLKKFTMLRSLFHNQAQSLFPVPAENKALYRLCLLLRLLSPEDPPTGRPP